MLSRHVMQGKKVSSKPYKTSWVWLLIEVILLIRDNCFVFASCETGSDSLQLHVTAVCLGVQTLWLPELSWKWLQQFKGCFLYLLALRQIVQTILKEIKAVGVARPPRLWRSMIYAWYKYLWGISSHNHVYTCISFTVHLQMKGEPYCWKWLMQTTVLRTVLTYSAHMFNY